MKKIILLVLCLTMVPATMADVMGVYYSAEATANYYVDGSWYAGDSDSQSGATPPAIAEAQKTVLISIGPSSFKGGSAWGSSSADYLSLFGKSSATATNYSSGSMKGVGYARAYALFEISTSLDWTLDTQFIYEKYGNGYTTLLMDAKVYETEIGPTPIEHFQRYFPSSSQQSYTTEFETASFGPGLYYLTLEVESESIASLNYGNIQCQSLGWQLAADVTIIPVPGAVLLGMLGLSVAGVKLRKRA